MKTRVYICGAGPVGIVTALNLCQRGIPVTILEAEETVCQELRASYYHAPSVDMLDDIGLLEPLLAGGTIDRYPRFTDVALDRSVVLDLSVLERKYRHPYALNAGQNWFARAGRELLRQYDCEFLFSHKVRSAAPADDSVSIEVDTPDGLKTLSADWLIGCDGGRSNVRKSVGIEFEGFTWKDRFLLVETQFDFEPIFGLLNYRANGPDWRLVIKISDGPGDTDWVYRVVQAVQPEQDIEPMLGDEYCHRTLQDLHPLADGYDVSARTVYNVHQQVATTFRQGRVLLAGDAAHLNNPIGGLGLNSGIHDAFNLAEKFVRVWKGKDSESLLDLYDRQRRLTNLEYIQKISVENKRRNEDANLQSRAKMMDYLEETASDDGKLFGFLNRWAMGESLDYAARIT